MTLLPVWIASGILGLVAAALHLPIDDRPIACSVPALGNLEAEAAQ